MRLLLMVVCGLGLMQPASAEPWPGVLPDMPAQTHWMTVTGGGQSWKLKTTVCRPPGDAPAGLAVFSHGRAANDTARARQQTVSCNSESVRWFVSRGYVVIAPLRPGYGPDRGPDIEAQSCNSGRDYAAGAEIAARPIDAAIAYAYTLPFVRQGRVVVVGKSAGGLASLAYGSHPHRDVVALINMAGGNGGHMHDQANNNCLPGLLATATAKFGRTSSIAELWIYAENDSFFAPEIARDMHAAFVKAGGHAELEQVGPFGRDGHMLFDTQGGMRIWGPLFERYLAGK